MSSFYVYILASNSRTLYIGVTNDLERRLYEHKAGAGETFTSQYKINHLVYYEETTDVTVAIAREKQLKGWRREKKIALIEKENPHWFDLADRWYDGRDPRKPGVQPRSKPDPSTTASTPSLRMTAKAKSDDR